MKKVYIAKTPAGTILGVFTKLAAAEERAAAYCKDAGNPKAAVVAVHELE